mmetsp:Transcript_24817/g.43693  ORF Transcript_24817/g.43693 Transcript_24817/m.43693 type:complete len:482 (-) Transcript_24817:59-1504(-)
MSALLVEALADIVPIKLPPADYFDRELLVISESTILPVAVRSEYMQVHSCEDFMGKQGKRFFIRTSSELYRGIIAGTLNSNYILSIWTERPDLYSQMLKTIRLYDPERPIKVPEIAPPLKPSNLASSSSAASDSSSVSSKEENKQSSRALVYPESRSSPSTQVVSQGALQKACNIVINNIIGSHRLRETSVSGLLRQMVEVLNGRYARMPHVDDKQRAAQLMLECFVKAGFLTVEGQNIVYNDAQCRNKAFPMLSTIVSQLQQESAPTKPDTRQIRIRVTRDDPVYLTTCNRFLNNYLSSPRRSSTPQGVFRELEQIISRVQVSEDLETDLAHVVFCSFLGSKHYKVEQGIMLYTPSLCYTHKLTPSNVPPPIHSSADQYLNSPQQQGPSYSKQEVKADTDKVAVREKLTEHIGSVLERVIQSPFLNTHVEIMNSIQKALLSYEKEARLAFTASQVEEIVKAIIQWLKEAGYSVVIPEALR